MVTANDIRTCVFSRAGRGYKIQDVDDFLEEAADSMEHLQKENEELIRKLEVLADRIQEYRNDEDSIRSALLTAQKSADRILKEATEQKETIVVDARQQAEDMLRLSHDKSVAIATETKERATEVLAEAKEKASRLLLEAKQKSEDMLAEAVEGCRAEKKYLDFLKEQEKNFRQEIVEMYKKQFELLKRGPELVKELDQSMAETEEPVTVHHVEAEESAEEVMTETAELVMDETVEEPVEETISDVTEEEEEPIYSSPEDILLPVDVVGEKDTTEDIVSDSSLLPNAEQADENDEQVFINDGFSVKRRFTDLKFGDDYDISSDDEYDEV